ncbi:MAG: MarR family winged helix-turn-helix transcriptional regulator [Janthinobacterium lividum]
MTARYDQALAPAGLSSAQFELLCVLSESGEVHGRPLAELLAVDPTTLSRNLKALAAEKIVRARRSETDARQTVYSLTAKGEERLKLARPMWLRAHQALQAELGTETEPIRATLQSLTARLRA